MLNLASRARPFFGAVVATVLLLAGAGLYCAGRMPLAVYPEVTFSRVAVVAKVPALDVATMELKVTRPLEEAVRGVVGVTQVRSKTIRGGSELYLDFIPGTDMRQAKTDTWNYISSVIPQLPAGVDLTVEPMSPSVFPIMSVVLTGGDNASQLRDYAFYELAPRMKNVPEVRFANVAGGDVREIEVEARPDDLLTAGLSAADLADQIGKLHILQPVGRVERAGSFGYQMLVNTQGTGVRDVEDLVISTKGNQPLRVRDVADVRVLHEDRVMSIGYQRRDAVMISIHRQLGGNTVAISKAIHELAARKHPGNIQATVVYDQASMVSTSVDNVRDAILVGGAFSILILFAFLRSWRATLISALAIPTTLAITMLLLYWSGATLNLMSLGGLAVAIGLIIDDTVVVIENIARHLTPSPPTPLPRRGEGGHLPPHAPSGRGAGGEGQPDPVDAASGEITGAVIGSTLTTVLVFVPLAFIVGVYGQFFASLSWALSAAVLVSMVISLTLVPVTAAKFLAGRPMPAPGRIYHFLEHLYELGLKAALRVPVVPLALSLAAVGGIVLLFTGIPDPRPAQPAAPAEGQAKVEGDSKIPRPPLVKGLETGLMPSMDEGAFILDYFAPSGTPLQRTEELAQEVEKILSKNPDVESFVRRTGSENGIFATQTNRGDITVILRSAEDDPVSLVTKRVRPKLDDPTFQEELKQLGRDGVRRKYRRRAADQIMDEVADEVHDTFSEHQLRIETIPIMEDELNDMSGASRPIEVKLFGPDQKVLRDLADKVGDLLEKNGKGRGLTEVNSNVFEGNPDLMIHVDPVRSAKFGLTPQEVQRQLSAMFFGQIATQVRESAIRITDVRVRYPDRVRFGREAFDPERLLDQWLLVPDSSAPASGAAVASASAALAGPARAVRVSAVARVEPLRTPDEQWRENQQPAIFVTAELKPEEAGLTSVVADIRRWMAGFPLPPGYRWDVGGHYIRYEEAASSFVVVIVVAVFLVYLMLAFQFRSVLLPLLIFLTQPLSLGSGLLALWLTRTPLNVSSYMGLILLIGLDMKNGILLVEYIQRLRAQGMELRPALLQAGRVRFRPILMTSLAAILGMLPLALGIGPGAQMQKPLAITVIGGLTANMLFTRMIIPVGYEFGVWVRNWGVRPRPAKKLVPVKA
jgi:multidrug efflux pump subunit AcrB